jgi:hypothetical protein
MVAGVLLLTAELLELLPVFDDIPFSELPLTGIFTFQITLYLVGLILLAVGLIGLYAHQSETAGPLRLVGFLIAAGTVFFTGFFWANTISSSHRPWRSGHPIYSTAEAVPPGSACR